MKFFNLLLMCIIATCTLNAQTYLNQTLEIDGTTRSYILFIPSSFQANKALPLVLNLHGQGSTANEQSFYSKFDQIAEREGFIVATPQGLVDVVPDGRELTQWNIFNPQGADDVAFLDKLIDTIYTEYNIDLSRVYSTGMSNGGFMSYKLACELSDRIAAIASVTGSTFNFQLATCAPGRAIPVMQVHGTADTTVPFNGSPFLVPVPDLVAYWVNFNQTNTTPTIFNFPDINKKDQSTVQKLEYTNGRDNSEVAFYIVQNGGHTWPGGTIDIPTSGPTNRDFNATEEIWKFFKKFSHPNPRPGMEKPQITTPVEQEFFSIAPTIVSRGEKVSIQYNTQNSAVERRMRFFNLQTGAREWGFNDYLAPTHGETKVVTRSIWAQPGFYAIQFYNPFTGEIFETGTFAIGDQIFR